MIGIYVLERLFLSLSRLKVRYAKDRRYAELDRLCDEFQDLYNRYACACLSKLHDERDYAACKYFYERLKENRRRYAMNKCLDCVLRFFGK